MICILIKRPDNSTTTQHGGVIINKPADQSDAVKSWGRLTKWLPFCPCCKIAKIDFNCFIFFKVSKQDFLASVSCFLGFIKSPVILWLCRNCISSAGTGLNKPCFSSTSRKMQMDIKWIVMPSNKLHRPFLLGQGLHISAGSASAPSTGSGAKLGSVAPPFPSRTGSLPVYPPSTGPGAYEEW